MNYRSAPEETERAADRRNLQVALKAAIGSVLTQHEVAENVEYACELSTRYRVERETQELHEYVTEIKLKNKSSRRIDDWHVDVEIRRRYWRPQNLTSATSAIDQMTTSP